MIVCAFVPLIIATNALTAPCNLVVQNCVMFPVGKQSLVKAHMRANYVREQHVVAVMILLDPKFDNGLNDLCISSPKSLC